MKRTVSRRSLLKKAGWAAPVVVAVAIPMHASASPDPLSPMSQGYWKNHPEAWPPDKPIIIGDTIYNTNDPIPLLAILATQPKGGDARYILAHQLIAAQLNVAIGCDPPAGGLIDAANEWLKNGKYPLSGSPPPKGSPDRNAMITLAEKLDAYNNAKPYN